MSYRGRAHVLGDDVNTDYITPTDYFGEPIETIAEHLFEPVDPDFTERFDPGDVVVAGTNFGSGSSRETAPKAMHVAGVSAVVAESFARIFYRNCIAIGLPVIVCPGVTDGVETGDAVAVDLGEGVVTNETTGATFAGESMPDAVQEIFDAGGLVAHFEQQPDGLRGE